MLDESESTTRETFSGWRKPWQFDDTSDEEVPEPTLLQAAVRHARSQAHVQTRLLLLRTEVFHERLHTASECEDGSLSDAEFELTGSGFALDTPELGIVNPSSWRMLGHSVVLDRRWLHEVNAYVFDQDGILKEHFLHMKKPRSLPLLYWKWLKGEEVRGAETWAQGWTIGGPTLEWLRRWKDGELTSKEVSGLMRVGFTLDDVVMVFASLEL
jgi:hypothetical protein